MVNIELRILKRILFRNSLFSFGTIFVRREEDTFSLSFFHSLDSMA